MKRLFTRLVACVAIISVAATMGITAFAQTEMDNMVFAGYDTTDPYSPNRIYNEVIKGKYTNKQVLVPVAPTWSAEGYEGVYPYAGYDRMYLDGKKQPITRYNNLFPQWETRRRDYMWEIKAPYVIWERQQTKVNNKTWTWDFGNDAFSIPDSAVKTRTSRTAYVVDISMKEYGFGRYDKSGDLLDVNEQRMYSDFSVNAINTWNNLVNNEFTVAKLSARNPETNKYVMSDEDIAKMIPVVYSKYITAKFNKTGKAGLTTKNVAQEYLLHMNDGWQWDYDSFEIRNDAKISWTAPSYEMAEPYNYYQYLIVNGVVLDGENGKDRVLRYTGGKATPKVTWKFAFFQNAKDANGNLVENVYEVVERKYVDGKEAVDANNNPIYRVPTGEYGNTYFKLNGNMIEYWVVDKAGNKTLLSKTENWTGNLGGLIDAYISGSVYCAPGVVAAQQYKDLP
ncbi:MAG: hypothetical protein IJN36_00040 [Clostridia bacterium]|nr:hypothetical protein [Clostridia bacterium]